MATVEPKIKQIALSDGEHDINAKYIQDGSGNAKTWSDITNLVETSFDVKVLSGTLPTPNASAYADYKNSIVLCNNGKTPTTGTYIEWVITKSGTTTPTYDWEEIGTSAADLSDYAKKGTYTTTGPNTNATGSAGEQTASGTATVTYKKSDAATGSAGSHNHTVTAPTASFVTGVKTTGGTANAVTGYPNFSGGSASGTFVTSAIKNVKLSGSTTTSTGAVTYVEAISGSAPSLEGTKTFNTDAIKSVTLSNDATSTTGPTYVQSISGSAPSLGGTTSFNTDAIKDITLAASDTSTDGPAYISAVSGTFNTDAIKAISGTKNYGFSASTSNVMTAPTVSSAGVLSWTLVNAGTQDAHTGTAAATGSVSGTTKYMKHTNTTASKAAVTISGGSYSATTKYMKATGTAAGTGTVSISGGSYSATTKYLTGTGDAAATGSVSWTAAALGTASTATFIKSDGLATGNAVTSVTLSDAGAHTHSIGLTDTSITGTAAVAVSAHTHSLSNHTHSVTI